MSTRSPKQAVEWRVLRESTVSIGGVEVDLTTRSRSVLLSLALEANHDIPIDRVIDMLWGDDPPRTARNSVARFVADLRRALGQHADRVETSTRGYRLVVHEGELDLERVEAALADDDGDLDAIISSLTDALDVAGMTPNPLLSELRDGAAFDRAHTETRISVIEALVDARRRRGDHRELVAMLEQAVAVYPYHEVLWCSLMISLDAAGRQAEALRAGQRLRGLLTEIGVLVSSSIVQVEQRILDRMQGTIDGGPGPGSSEAGSSPRISDPGTSLVGRMDDLKDLHRAVQGHRHVSVVGLGGAGKTRMALAIIRAEEATHRVVYQVGLAAVGDPALVVPTVAAALGIPPASSRDAVTVARSVSPDPFLLVLDNCEHVRDVCGDLVAALATDAPHVRVLTTSRVPLGVKAEHVFAITPLATASEEDANVLPAAVELFVERAGLLLDREMLSVEDFEVIADICRSLAGLPLAIEVAAAQLSYGSPSELLDRLRAPTHGAGSVEEPSLDVLSDVLDWIWSSLTPTQQTLLARLSVFDSGWTRDAIATVCGASPTAEVDLEYLIKACAVVANGEAEGVRYEIIAGVREFAQARLADRRETDAILDRLAARTIETVNRHGFAAQHALAASSRAVLPEHGNLTASLAHLNRTGRLNDLADLGTHVAGMWTNHRYPTEIIRWLGPLVEDDSLSDRARSGCAFSMCVAHHTLGDLDKIEPFGTRALELADGHPYDWIPGGAGYMAIWSVVSDTPLSTEEYSALSLESAERSPSAELNMGIAAMYRGQLEFIARRYEAALGWYDKARAATPGPGRQMMLVETTSALSKYLLGRKKEAADDAENWISRHDTDHWHYIVPVMKAIVVGGAGDPEKATAELTQAVRSQPGAMVWGQADVVQTAFALLADFRGEPDLAADLFANANNRDFTLIAFTVEHLLNKRGQSGDEAWLTTAAELWTRVVPEGTRSSRARTTSMLLDWWSGSEATLPSPHVWPLSRG